MNARIPTVQAIMEDASILSALMSVYVIPALAAMALLVVLVAQVYQDRNIAMLQSLG